MKSFPYYSPTRIRQLFKENGIWFRRRWGQNFLTDPNHARIIAEHVLLNCPGPLLEIGPGLGALTHLLLAEERQVTGVEIDPFLVSELIKQFKQEYPRFQIIKGDALKFLASPLETQSICGNLPYSISTDLLTAVVKRPEIKRGIFLLQTEFADRVVAPESISSLGVFLNNFGSWRIIHRIPATAFYPQPKIDSSLLFFAAHQEGPRCDREILEQILRLSFGSRRKKLANAWKNKRADLTFREKLQTAAAALPLDLSKRAEEIEREKYYKLANLVISL